LLAYVAMFAVVVFVWHRVQPPWWDHAQDVSAMEKAIQSGKGYEGTDEYVPIGADAYDVDQAARRVWLVGPGHAQFRVLKWGAEEKEFTAEVSEGSEVAVRLFNYPAWRVEVNGNDVKTRTREETGEMVVPVSAGRNEVKVQFGRTRDRTVGGVISGVMSVFLVVGFLIKRRPESH